VLVGKPRHIQYLADRDIRSHFFEFVAAAVLVGVNSIERAYADRPLDYRLVRDNTQVVDAVIYSLMRIKGVQKVFRVNN